MKIPQPPVSVPAPGGESEKVMKDFDNNQIGVAADNGDKNQNNGAGTVDIFTEGI